MAAIEALPTTPASVREALESPEAEHWVKAINEELDMIHRTGTVYPCDLPVGKRALGTKLVLKLKTLANGLPERYKARLVVLGNHQRFGEDFFETYAPVLRYESLRLLLAFAIFHDLEIHQMDVEGAFLQAELDEEIYVRPPEGYRDPKHPHKVWRLVKSLYGLKQAPMIWNQKIDGLLKSKGYTPMQADPCVYIRWEEDKVTIVSLFVDDIIIIANKELLDKTKDVLKAAFPVKDLNEPTSVLGMEFLRDREKGTLRLRQSGHIGGIIKRAGLENSKPCPSPAVEGLKLPTLEHTAPGYEDKAYPHLVGALLYVACTTRWDIGYIVAYLCRFTNAWGKEHWEALKRVVRYLHGTRDFTITYSRKGTEPTGWALPVGYSDSDWAGDTVDRKSISGNVFLLAGGPISWASKKQKSVAVSSCEAELLALSQATLQGLYLRRFLEPLRLPTNESTTIYTDSQSSMAVVNREERGAFHARLKHLDVRALHIADSTSTRLINLEYCPTNEMVADILTKSLSIDKFCRVRDLVGPDWMPPSTTQGRVLEVSGGTGAATAVQHTRNSTTNS